MNDKKRGANNFELQLYKIASAQEDAYAKAIASFLFREIIEDAHVKYHISQDDIRNMTKEAINRAALLIEIQDTPMYKAFLINAIYGLKWDNADTNTEFAHSYKEALSELSKLID